MARLAASSARLVRVSFGSLAGRQAPAAKELTLGERGGLFLGFVFAQRGGLGRLRLRRRRGRRRRLVRRRNVIRDLRAFGALEMDSAKHAQNQGEQHQQQQGSAPGSTGTHEGCFRLTQCSKTQLLENPNPSARWKP
jgi:hypothetical protein